MPDLSDFEGHLVVGTTIAITNAGDGLSKALQIDPTEYDHGDVVHVVLECEVTKIRFDPSKDDPNSLIRHHVLKAGTSTVVEGSTVAGVLAAQRKKIEEAEGVQQLDLDGTDDDGEGGQDLDDDAA